MANLNKVSLIGRLTRDPEPKTFSNGGKVCSFGFAVNNRKKNQQTGEWEDDACFLDVKAFNRETGRKLADVTEEYLHKGELAYLEGHLVMERWQDKDTGGNRQKLVVVVDDVQLLQPRGIAGGVAHAAPGREHRQPAAAPASAPLADGDYPEVDVPF